VGVKNCRYDKGTGNREQGTGFGQVYFSLLVSVFSAHLLRKYCSQPYPLPLWGTGVSKPLP
ncbi:hypothetical protein, partial [Dolichospermum circinale]|uniref:hypothetical protein n=1 Tax=Dolichospermum circinale TaxID=109265 RepID=UPI001E4A81D6